jgi:hypothetical protein
MEYAPGASDLTAGDSALLVDEVPVLELVSEKFAVEIGNPHLQTCLHFGSKW